VWTLSEQGPRAGDAPVQHAHRTGEGVNQESGVMENELHVSGCLRV